MWLLLEMDGTIPNLNRRWLYHKRLLKEETQTTRQLVIYIYMSRTVRGISRLVVKETTKISNEEIVDIQLYSKKTTKIFVETAKTFIRIKNTRKTPIRYHHYIKIKASGLLYIDPGPIIVNQVWMPAKALLRLSLVTHFLFKSLPTPRKNNTSKNLKYWNVRIMIYLP